MRSGHFLGVGPWTEASGQWLALEQREREFSLREVVVRSVPEAPACSGEGSNVLVAGVDAGTFLIRGVAALRPGLVTALFSEPRYVAPGQTLQLGHNDGWAFFGEGTVKPATNAGEDETRTTDYRLILRDANRQAIVFSLAAVDNDGPPEILWVGRLDADDIPDILADVRSHYAGHIYKLFLSSAAGPGLLVAEVASLATLGC
jgi:hypothetical protein